MNLVAAIDITNLHKKIGILEKKSSSGGLINFVYDDIDLFEILSIPSLKQSRISENSSYWYVTYKNISVIDAARKKLIHQPIHADFFFRFSFFFFPPAYVSLNGSIHGGSRFLETRPNPIYTKLDFFSQARYENGHE